MRRAATRGLVVLAAATLAACAVADVGAFDRGTRTFQVGLYREAVDAFSEALCVAPRSVAAYNNRAVARMRLGDPTGAIEDYTRALEIVPSDADVLFNRGDARVVAGDFTGGIDDFTRAMALRPGFARARFNRGTVFLIVGDYSGARADFLAAIDAERDPGVKAEMQRAAEADVPGRGFPAALPPVPPMATVTAQQLDARALAMRGIGRDLDDDRAGAIQDLRSALGIETDPGRRAAIERLLRALETPR